MKRLISTSPTGWADDRMMRAYDLIWKVQNDHTYLGITSEFNNLLEAIDLQDSLILEVQREQADG